MHLLAATPGVAQSGEDVVDTEQTPAQMVFLSAADSEIAAVVAGYHGWHQEDASFPTLRAQNLLALSHPMSVDLYTENIIRHARVVIVRLLGGRGYWPYGVERLVAVCAEHKVALAILPGDDKPDDELTRLSSVSTQRYHLLWQYCVHGGADNMRGLLAEMARVADYHFRPSLKWAPPAPLLTAGFYRPPWMTETTQGAKSQPTVAIIFYRALLQGAGTTVIDALAQALQRRGLWPLPLYAYSLKDPVAAAIVDEYLHATPPDCVVNLTGFALSSPNKNFGEITHSTLLNIDTRAPIIQAVLAADTHENWQAGTQGLGPRDIAMNVALPEVDGRIISTVVAFKVQQERDPLTQSTLITHAPCPDRMDFVAAQAHAWVRLRQTPHAQKRIAMILANYPNQDGRIGNGVGLDTPASCVRALQTLQEAGYTVGTTYENGGALMDAVLAGRTNAHARYQTDTLPEAASALSLTDYELFYRTLPEPVRTRMETRWGAPHDDPFFIKSANAFRLPALENGHVILAIQPARGYNIDPATSYHDPDLPPPHGYAALYCWLRRIKDVHAVIHMGKHGNLEWLPGKSLALSAMCFPEAMLGPMAHIYPFIVNDPGEGTQGKRRAAAVVIDHLTPPLARAESHGAAQTLERLVDEYFDAAQMDARRCAVLRDEILSLCHTSGIAEECNMNTDTDAEQSLVRLDDYLCTLKEMQIKNGLHIFGKSPTDRLRHELLVSLIRAPGAIAGLTEGSLLRALSTDTLGANVFDPVTAENLGEAWQGPRPQSLWAVNPDSPWRTCGHTLERLEQLSLALISKEATCLPEWDRTAAVLAWVDTHLGPGIDSCGVHESGGLLDALDGKFVAPGPSGAPSRGRLDVLPTGRNFYSVDTRAVPSMAAWSLGWKSATLLLETWRQDHGDWPQTLGLSIWGTSNMRTGGDDIAQALALMGVQPQWDSTSGRVAGIEVMPLSVLGRPRVDVMIRISGFFRDAFPAQIQLLDDAVKSVACLDEPAADNPLAARVREDTATLVRTGTASDLARQQAAYRIFGSKPSAYGAGLQALIDEKGWESDADLARAYIAWGGYAYGAKAEGVAAHGAFEHCLGALEGVLHNQDNREHDVLDSDDYYQFEGGMAVAVRTVSGRQPHLYHNDHSRIDAPRIRTLEDEIARVIRARVINPKWIEGVMRHGYKGAFEMAATLDYMFAFAATAKVVKDYQFDMVFEAFIADDVVRDFIHTHNPMALEEMVARFNEARTRGLWQSRRNDVDILLSTVETH